MIIIKVVEFQIYLIIAFMLSITCDIKRADNSHIFLNKKQTDNSEPILEDMIINLNNFIEQSRARSLLSGKNSQT
jgi:hypothetical protein